MNLIVFNIAFFTGMSILFINFLLFAFLKNKKRIDKIFAAYLLCTLTENLTCFSIFHLLPGANYFISHFYFLVHFTFLSLLFYSIIENTKIRKLIWVAYFGTYAVLGVLFYINPKSFFGFHLFETISIGLLIITYAFITIFQSLELEKRYYYFSIGVVINFSVSTLIYISGSLETVTVFSVDPHIDHWIFKDLTFIVFQVFVFRQYLYEKRRDELPA